MKEPRGVDARQSRTHRAEQCQKPTAIGLPGTKAMGNTHSPTPVLSHISSLTNLGIRLIPKGVKDFLDGHNLPSPPIHCLPHNAVGLRRRAISLPPASQPTSPPRSVPCRPAPPSDSGCCEGQGNGEGCGSGQGPRCCRLPRVPSCFGGGQMEARVGWGLGQELKPDLSPGTLTSLPLHPACQPILLAPPSEFIRIQPFLSFLLLPPRSEPPSLA